MKEFEESPLRSFHSLETNLKRERRVFSMVIVLLVCGAIAAAAITIAARLSETLRREEQAAQAYEQDVIDAILQHRSALITANMVLELRANGILPSPQLQLQRRCTPIIPTSPAQQMLRESCDEAVQLLSAASRPPRVEMVLADGSAAYGYMLSSQLPPPQMSHPQDPEAATMALVNAVLDRFRARGFDPVVAAREKRVVWLASLARSATEHPQMVGASLVLKDNQLYAAVLTSVDLHDVLQPNITDEQTPELIVIDDKGNPIVGGATADEARIIDSRLAAHQDGLFHWIPKYGWGLRRPPVLPGFGHLIHVLPWQRQVHAIRFELLLILSVTATLIVLLLAMFRYWNYRFLTRTYSEASRALESEMLNHLLVHTTPVGLCIVRKANLEIMVAKQITRNVLGLSQADSQLPDALRNEFNAQRKDISQNRDTLIFQFPFSLERNDDNSVHLEFTYAPATLNREEIFFCAIVDMTEHHRAQQLLREAQLTSEAAAKAKVNFFASMSHEIRTPLSSLVGNIELVALGPLAPEQQARVRAMQVSAKGLLQVVNDVLDFSKIDVGELSLSEEWASATDLLGRIATSYAPLATQQGLKFYIVFDRAIPSWLYFDPIRVSQIVDNLLSNAFKFTQSGKIIMRASWIKSNLEISIVDSGIGIPDELRQRLFQPFTQGDSNRLAQARGTGLGLSICARLCKLMKGRVALESTVGVGTRIVVTLPLRSVDNTAHPAEWTLSAAYPVILCRAAEYQEWLTNLFDPEVTAPVVVSDIRQPLDNAQYDFLLVTDEFFPDDVFSWWGTSRPVIRVTQAGPLVPALEDNGSVEVSIYSMAGITAATQMFKLDHRGKSLRQPQKGVLTRASRNDFGKLTVLIAEDNLLNRSLLRDQLGTLGAKVIEAANGDEALILLSKASVDIVLTDIDMPVMNGFQLLEEIRNKGVQIPIYAISASARPEDIAEGRARGFTDYLTKPVPLSALTSVLESTFIPDDASPHIQAGETALPDFPHVPAEYTDTFVKQVELDLLQLDTTVKERSTTQLRQWLHRVAGGLSVLGPSRLLEDCHDLRVYIAETAQWNDEIELQCMAIADVLRMMHFMLLPHTTLRDSMPNSDALRPIQIITGSPIEDAEPEAGARGLRRAHTAHV
jgi:two-component system capsular synthesis sensor histidine kinase RcsC